MTLEVGISALSFYIPRYTFDLSQLAKAYGLDPEIFLRSLGQKNMACPPPCEDTISMAVNAALQLKDNGVNFSNVQAVLFATESSTDQSKAASLLTHTVLGLPDQCRSMEIKQACYAGTAALRMAMGLIAMQPEWPVLVLMSDIARYERKSSGEATMGSGAVAMLVSKRPNILIIEPFAGLHAENVHDFWRPAYLSHAMVEPHYSVKQYTNTFEKCWERFRKTSGLDQHHIDRFCYHTPSPAMVERLHYRFRGQHIPHLRRDQARTEMQSALLYNRMIGNAYTASLFISLASLLENERDDLTQRRIGLFSYGSGCMGEYFSAKVKPGYKEHLNTQVHQSLLHSQVPMSLGDYETFYNFELSNSGDTLIPQFYETGPARLTAHILHRRHYNVTQGTEQTLPDSQKYY